MKEQIEKYFLGELTSEEKKELLRQVESDKEWEKEFIHYQNTQALLSLSDIVMDKEEGQKELRAFMNRIRRQKGKRLFLRVAGYAAAIALLVVSVHYLHVYSYSNLLSTTTTLYVPPGQRVNITLQDGTVVWLNARTTLTYPAAFLKGERHVQVEGEAYFEVAEDKNKPFIVSTQNVNMKVLGTSFNVRSYSQEGYINTGLVEGRLLVYFQGEESKGIVLNANDQILIRDNKMVVSPITHADHFLWRNGIYSFDSESLSDLLKKLEMYFDVTIHVSDPADFQWKYTGKLRQQDGIEEILRVIQRIHKFKIEKDKETNTFILSK